METLALALGLFLLALTLWDVFEGVIVPRPTPGRFRIGRYVVRGSWGLLRLAARGPSAGTRDQVFGIYGPAVPVPLLVTRISGLILGHCLGLLLPPAPTTPLPPSLRPPPPLPP